MIATLLPAFYRAFGDNPAYTVASDSTVAPPPHESAWVRLDGTVVVELNGSSAAGTSFTTHEFLCDCFFREGMAWRRVDGLILQIARQSYDFCRARAAALTARRREMNAEYQPLLTSPGDTLLDHAREIVTDLFSRVQAGQFVGQGASGPGRLPGGIGVGALAVIFGVEPRVLEPYLVQLVDSRDIRIADSLVLPHG